MTHENLNRSSFSNGRTIDVDQGDVDRGRIVLPTVVGVDYEGVSLDVFEVDLLP